MSLLSSIKKLSTLGTDTSFKVPAVDDKETLLNTVGHLFMEFVTANGSCINSSHTKSQPQTWSLVSCCFFFPLHVYVIPGKSTATSL